MIKRVNGVLLAVSVICEAKKRQISRDKTALSDGHQTDITVM